MTSDRPAFGAFSVIAIALAAYLTLAISSAWVSDDAFIAFRYGRNFAEGLGLRFNLGVDPPVEGYTQLGWVLYLGLIERLGLDPVIFAPAGSIAAGAVLLVALLRLGRDRLGLGPPALLVAGLFFATFPSVLVWSSGGLGTMPFALAIFLAAERLLADPDRPRVAAAALAMVAIVVLRADGVYWVALILGYAVLASVRPGGRQLVRPAVTCGVLVAFVVAGLFAFRLGYHGDWLPNTVRAKVGMSLELLRRGACYLLSYWLAIPAAALLLGLGVALGRRGEEAWLRVCAFLIGGTFLYGVLVGGDFMAMGRFFLPTAPFLALVAGRGAQVASDRHGGSAAAGCGAVFLVLSAPAAFDVHLVPSSVRESVSFRWHGAFQSEHSFWRGMEKRAKKWADLGRFLGQHADPDASVVRIAIGAVGYYSNLFIYDQAGLVNREVVRDVPVAHPLKMPSHDRIAEISYFAGYEPTYARVFLRYGKGSTQVWPGASSSEVIEFSAEDGYAEDGFVSLSYY